MDYDSVIRSRMQMKISQINHDLSGRKGRFNSPSCNGFHSFSMYILDSDIFTKQLKRCEKGCEFASYKSNYRCVNCHNDRELETVDVDLPAELLVIIFLYAEISILDLCKSVKIAATDKVIDKILKHSLTKDFKHVYMSDEKYKLFVFREKPKEKKLFTKYNYEFSIRNSSHKSVYWFTLIFYLANRPDIKSYSIKKISKLPILYRPQKQYLTIDGTREYLESSFQKLKRAYDIEIPESLIIETVRKDYDNQMSEPDVSDEPLYSKTRMFKAAYLLTMVLNGSENPEPISPTRTNETTDKTINSIIEIFEPLF